MEVPTVVLTEAVTANLLMAVDMANQLTVEATANLPTVVPTEAATEVASAAEVAVTEQAQAQPATEEE